MTNDRPFGLDDLRRVSAQLPSKVTCLRLKSTYDHRTGPSRQHVERWSGETWMEYGPACWIDEIGQIIAHIAFPSPIRWREEGAEGWIHGQDATTTWQDLAPGLFVQSRGKYSRSYPRAAWTGSRFWTSIGGTVRLDSIIEHLGRRAAEVHLVNVDPGDLRLSGDEQRVVVDLETGLLLRFNSYANGELLVERRVTEISFPVSLPGELFSPPSGKIPVKETTQLYTNIDEMAGDWTFPLLLPTDLPKGYEFSDGSIRLYDGEVHWGWATLHYLAHRGKGMLEITERLAATIDTTPPTGWERVQRKDRAVFVSAVTNGARPQRAQVTIGEICIRISASLLSLEEVLELAFSLA